MIPSPHVETQLDQLVGLPPGHVQPGFGLKQFERQLTTPEGPSSHYSYGLNTFPSPQIGEQPVVPLASNIEQSHPTAGPVHPTKHPTPSFE